MLVVNALGSCHKDCRFCAKEFYRWYKTRMAQMAVPQEGQTTTFAQAAATSVKPE